MGSSRTFTDAASLIHTLLHLGSHFALMQNNFRSSINLGVVYLQLLHWGLV